MLQTIFNNQPVFLITEEPDWTDLPACDFMLTRDRQTGLTRREAARPFSSSLLTKVTYTVTLTGADLVALQGALRNLDQQPVILPFFLFKRAWSDRANGFVQGGLNVVWKEGFTDFAFYTTGNEPADVNDDDNWAPAVMGFITQSQPEMQSAETATFKIEFTESSPAAYALIAPDSAIDAGPQPAGYAAAPKLLPIFPDFTRISEALRVEVIREQIGFTREQSTTFYPHQVFRGQQADYSLTGDQPGLMLRFFQDFAGPGKSFWAPSWLKAATLISDIADTDTIVNVEDNIAVQPGDYLAFWGDNFAFAQVDSLPSPITIKLKAAPGIDLNWDSTLIFPLNLVRLDEAKLTFSWASGELVTCTLAVTEQKPEYTPAADETLGQTLGGLPLRVVLFEFNRDLGNGTIITNRFTSFEQDIVDGAYTWISGKYSHGDIPLGLNLEDDEVDLTGFIDATNPMLDDVTLRAQAPLAVIIRWADFDGTNLSNVEEVFTGEVTAPSRDGNKLTAKAVAGPSELDIQLPRMVHGVMCNHINGANVDGSFLVSFGCTLLKDDWKFTATVANPISSAFPYALNLAGLARVIGPAPTFFLDWFALGWLEWGVGANIQRLYILKSTIPAAGAITLKLQRWFHGAGPAAGDQVIVRPGCGGTPQTCRGFDAVTNPTGKFDNHINFGGEEFTPPGNPSLIKITTPANGTKK